MEEARDSADIECGLDAAPPPAKTNTGHLATLRQHVRQNWCIIAVVFLATGALCGTTIFFFWQFADARRNAQHVALAATGALIAALCAASSTYCCFLYTRRRHGVVAQATVRYVGRVRRRDEGAANGWVAKWAYAVNGVQYDGRSALHESSDAAVGDKLWIEYDGERPWRARQCEGEERNTQAEQFSALKGGAV